MARYSKDHKAASREKILRTAAKLFRKQGYEGTGLKEVMERSGLTVGTFYAHFPSKAALLAEAFTRTAGESRNSTLAEQEKDWYKTFVVRYLSRKHLENVENGCPFPSLISELSRAPHEEREKIERYLIESIEKYSKKTPEMEGLDQKERMLASFCMMIGAVSLSRAVVSKELSNQILNAAKKMALFDLKEDIA